MTFKQCPKQFEYFYNSDDYDSYNEDGSGRTSPQLVRGSYFHNVADKFFDTFDVEYCKELNSKHLAEYMDSKIPDTNDDLINEWLSYFIEYEQWRFENLKQENKLEYYIPLAREVKVSCEDTIDRTGHFDRIDIIGPGEAQIVEYKTGKSYNMEKPDRVTKMNAEIGFYATILRANKMFPEYNINSWKVINPTLRKVWVNKISKITLTSVDKAYARLCEMILQKEDFERNISDLCLYCPYVQDCHKNIRLGIDKIESTGSLF